MKLILTYLKPYLRRMAFGLTVKTLGTFTDLGLPWVLAYILDDVIPGKKVSGILAWGGVMLILAVITRQFNCIANRNAAAVSRDSVENISHDLFYKINQLSGSQVDELTIPSLISRMTVDTYNLHRMFNIMQRLGVRAPLLLIGGVIITSTLDPVLTIVLVAVLPFIAFTVFIVSKRGVPLFDKVQRSTDDMVRTVRENITGIRIIKALSKTEYEKQHFKEINKQLVEKELRAGKTMAASGPFIQLFLNIGLTVVVVVGAFRVNSGLTEPGKIIAFLSYFTIILNAVISLTRIFVVFSKASASAARIKEVLEKEEDLKVMPDLPMNPCKSDKNPPHIEFCDVTFRYGGSKENCLEHISFSIKKGESLGIIGSTGSGKTSLINLLMRFYDVTDGSILIDGRDIRTIPLTKLREKFGTAFQHDMIFQDSLFHNIQFGRKLTREQIQNAAADACAAEFIEAIEETYDYMAAIKGVNLSGGQKQRLYIARALAAKPEILILDDSSSALDYKTDAKLRKAIRNNYKDTTALTIAQRISSIHHMNHILVLEDGIIHGYGTHEELMEHCSVYQEIYQSQMGQGAIL